MGMAQPANILIVDDNAENRALAQAVLEDEGYQVLLASSGAEALNQVEREEPDCILLDIRMPVLDGLEVCHRLRSRGCDVPVIFLTAQRDIDTFDAALQAGGDDFLTKPVRPAELLVRVQGGLRLRQMSRELREQYDLVRQQRDALMRLQLQRERLSSFLVHDLKNPVSSLDLRAQQALRDPQLSGKTRRALLQIRDEARTLSHWIVNLLDISRSDAGNLTVRPEPVAIQPLAEQVLSELELRAMTAGVRLCVRVPSLVVQADADLLRRVLTNLVENAIRHSPENSEVLVEARAQGEHWELEVSDAGPGVPGELREKIFEPFVQVESGERVVTRAGRGLGLTFCRVAVEAHGGEIRVRDREPGTVFIVRLPLSDRSP